MPILRGGGVKSSKINFVGIAEWYVPAIVVYHTIHDNVKIIKNISQEDMRTYLSFKPLSIDSKTLVNKLYWNRIKDQKLQTIYSYVKFSEDNGNIFDVHLMVKKAPKNIDLLTYSFPCQDLSIQGKGKGITKDTRSGLLLVIQNYLKLLTKNQLPKYLLLENVKALNNKNHKEDFVQWIEFLDQLGYKTDFKILNSQNFGSAQKRERVFALSVLGDLKIELPESNNKPKQILADILDKKFDEKYRLKKLESYKRSEFQQNRGKKNIRRQKILNWTTFASETYIYKKDNIGPTLTASGANSRIKIKENNKIRVMNPNEALKYMRFTEPDYQKIKKHKFLSDTQIIFVVGNSIPIEILEEIFRKVVQ